MAIRYNKLWKKLIDENMMKVDLRDQAGMIILAELKMISVQKNWMLLLNRKNLISVLSLL